MINVEDWAEIRRLYRAEGIAIKEIVRRLGISRNTVRRALASDEPPKYQRKPQGSIVDPFVPQIQQLLADSPRMPATVIAERIGWHYSMTTLKDKVRQLRPLYTGVDPADRLAHRPCEAAQLDLRLRDRKVRLCADKSRMLPVLAMTFMNTRWLAAVMQLSRQSGVL